MSDMSTLPNVVTHVDESRSSSVRFVPCTIPEVVNSKTGESVEYVHHLDKKWFVFRSSYGRAVKACDFLISEGVYAYSPMQFQVVMVSGKRKRVLKPLLPNLVFAYLSPEEADHFVKHTSALSYLSYYYNHFSISSDSNNPPLTIPESEMVNFILATHSRNEHVRFVDERACHFRGGDMVRVIDGAFKGVTGRVARVAGQQRVVLSLSQIGMFCTAYIPTAFLMKVNS